MQKSPNRDRKSFFIRTRRNAESDAEREKTHLKLETHDQAVGTGEQEIQAISRKLVDQDEHRYQQRLPLVESQTFVQIWRRRGKEKIRVIDTIPLLH